MAGHSILYLGRNEFAPEFIEQLKQSPACERFRQSESMHVPDHDIGPVDVVLFEAGPGIVRSGQSLAGFMQAHSAYALVALTTHDREHRGIAASRAGAQGYLCVDDADVEHITAVVQHAIDRFALMARLSEADNTVLSILNSINDGVIVVDALGKVLDINPAGRSIIGMSPRELPGHRLVGTFWRPRTGRRHRGHLTRTATGESRTRREVQQPHRHVSGRRPERHSAESERTGSV